MSYRGECGDLIGNVTAVIQAREITRHKLAADSEEVGKKHPDLPSTRSHKEQLLSGAIPSHLAQIFTWLPPIGSETDPDCRLGNRLHDYLTAKSEIERNQALKELKKEADTGASRLHSDNLLNAVSAFDAGVRLYAAERALASNGSEINRDQLQKKKTEAMLELATLAYVDKFLAARTILEKDPNISEVVSARSAVLARSGDGRAPGGTGGDGGVGGAGADGHATPEPKSEAAKVSPEEAQARQVVKNLGPESSSEDFHKAAEELKQQNGPAAESWRQWANASEQIAIITEASKTKHVFDVDKAIGTLELEAKRGDAYAKQALAAILVGAADSAVADRWLEKYPDPLKRPLYVPNLSGFGDIAKASVLGRAAMSFGLYETLSASEAAALTVALCSPASQRQRDICGDYLAIVLESNLKEDRGSDKQHTPSELSAMSGVVWALECKTQPCDELLLALSRTAAQPTFAEQFSRIEDLAKQGDKAALRILADVAGGRSDCPRSEQQEQPKSPLVEPAQRTLAEVGEQPGKRADVVQAILDTFKLHLAESNGQAWTTQIDRHGLGATMGRLAAGLNPDKDEHIINEARTTLRKEIDQSRVLRGDVYKNAVDGLFAMSKLLKKEDLDFLLTPPNLTKEVADALTSNADAFSQEVRDYAIAKLKENLKAKSDAIPSRDSTEEKMSAIQGLAAFAKYLNKDDVNLIASFGGDAGQHSGGTGGAERVRELGVATESIKEFQSECGKVLLYILARTPNAGQGEIGSREAAYAAFRDFPWPLKDGKGGYLPSEKGAELKNALLDYYTGHPNNTEMAGEINRIVDDAKLPVPAVDVIHQLGVGDPKNLHDPVIKEIADQIVHNYDSPKESGTAVLRRVVANLEMVNSLPGYERAKLMGWTNDLGYSKFTDAEKTALGWVKEPPIIEQRALASASALAATCAASCVSAFEPAALAPAFAAAVSTTSEFSTAAKNWNQLTDEQKEAFRWSNTKIDVRQVLGQMCNNSLGDGINAALLQDLSGKVDAQCHNQAFQIEKLQNELDRLNDQRRGSDGQVGVFGDLATTTREGVSLGSKLASLPSFGYLHDADFENKQDSLLARLNYLDSEIATTQAKLQEADEKQHGLLLARDVGEYRRLVNTGDQSAADKLALSMWKEHGAALSVLAPEVWRDLTVSSENTLQGSILQRLNGRKLAQVGSVPGYDSGASGFKQALGFEKAANSDKPIGLIQLKKGLLDSDALQAHMFLRIDQDETLHKFSNAARNMNTDLEEFSRMFEPAKQGSMDENFAHDFKDKAARIEKEMAGITEEDRKNLAEKIHELESARDAMKDEPWSSKALVELNKHIETYKRMQDVFDPDGNIRKAIKSILDPKTTGQKIVAWLKENGPIIGATVVAMAATVAACATFGVTSSAAVGLWVAVSGLAAREGTNEILFQVNKNGYTGWGVQGDPGSRLGDWHRHIDPNDGFVTNLTKLGLKVAVPYALEIARDWAAFVGTCGITHYFFPPAGSPMSFTQAMASVFERPPANLGQLAALSERAALMANGRYGTAAASLIKQFMGQFGKELVNNFGFAAAQQGIEAGAEAVIGPDNMATLGALGQFGLSFAISTGLAMGQGYRHAKFLQSAELKPGNLFEFKLSAYTKESDFIKFMGDQGYQIKLKSPGMWEALPIDAQPGTMSITMKNITDQQSCEDKAGGFPLGDKLGCEPQGNSKQGEAHADEKIPAVVCSAPKIADKLPAENSPPDARVRSGAVAKQPELAQSVQITLEIPEAKQLSNAGTLAKLEGKEGAATASGGSASKAEKLATPQEKTSRSPDNPHAAESPNPAIEANLNKMAHDQKFRREVVEEIRRLSPQAMRDSGLADLLQANKLPRPREVEGALRYGRILDAVHEFPSDLKRKVADAMGSATDVIKNNTKLEILDNLCALICQQPKELAAQRMESALRVLEPLTTGETAAQPPVKTLEQIFTPEEIEIINRRLAAQQDLPRPKILEQERAALGQQNFEAARHDAAGGEPAKEKIMHIVVGPSGAGKSSNLVMPLAKEHNAMVVDFDRVVSTVPGYTAPMNGAPEVGLGIQAGTGEGGTITRNVLRQAEDKGYNIVHPCLGQSPDYLMRVIMDAKAKGYKVYIDFADTPPEVAARRGFDRSFDPPKDGVRQIVDPNFVLESGWDARIVYERMIKEMGWALDGHARIDTNVGRNEKPRVVEATPGTLPRSLDPKSQTPSETPKPEPPLRQEHTPPPGAEGQAKDQTNAPRMHVTAEDSAKASDDPVIRKQQQALEAHLREGGWPQKLARQLPRQLAPEDLKGALAGLNAEKPRAVFIGTTEPGSVAGRDEVTNAASVLYFTPENGCVHVIDEVPASALRPRFAEGDTALYEQVFFLDNNSLPTHPNTYEVPRAMYEQILRQVASKYLIEVTDPDYGQKFLTVIPGREAEVGKLIVAELQRRGMHPQ